MSQPMSSDHDRHDSDPVPTRLYNPCQDLQVPIENLYKLPTSPEFLFVEEARRQRRSWGENLTFYTGCAYLAGAISGGSVGLLSGVRSFEAGDTTKLRINRILNASGHTGRVWANRLGVIGLLYAGMESGVQALRDTDDVWNGVAAGLGTGAVYRAARGVRSAAVAGAVGGALAGLAVGAKQALKSKAAVALAEMEKQKSKAAMDAARMAQWLAEMEIQKRKMAEMRAKEESKQRRKAMDALAHNKAMYRRYSIEEVEVATDYFDMSNKVGEGGYGPVYKGVLDHTPVAIKVLRPDMSQGKKQFQQEVDVLSCIRHPHLVILVGACPEYGCLIYEYMDNGSLEDRLLQKGNTHPIPWTVRFKIAAEIATGLLFLHQIKPEPLVHRDLKPANILLDRNYVSKIADVGLARLVPASVADSVTQYLLTTAAGTFCYIDPEYQQTGMLCVKSDIYSLGIMLLQIITSRPAMGLPHKVEESIEKGTFADILDPAVPDWPVELALSFAKLALKCCELRRKDRPDLGSVILPELEQLIELGNREEANNYAMVPYREGRSLPPPVVRSTTTASQINVRKRWMRLQYLMTKLMSFRNNSKRASSSSASHSRFGKSSLKHEAGCWSFVSQCSTSVVADTPLRRFKSFS